MKVFIQAIFVAAVYAATVRTAYAVTVPEFPTCANPNGQVLASYSTGIHAIPGSSTAYTGSDNVYKVNENQVLQCLCADNGHGYQTNWLKATQFTEVDINTLKAQGWYYIPDGSVWGLDQGPYVAQNISFNCKPGEPGTGGGGGSSGGIGGGDILADAASTTRGNVLGLAATGDITLVLGVFAFALLLSILAYRIVKFS